MRPLASAFSPLACGRAKAGPGPAAGRHGRAATQPPRASGAAAAAAVAGSSLDQSSRQSRPSGGASSGSGMIDSSRSVPRLTSSSRSSPSPPEEAQHEGLSPRTAPSTPPGRLAATQRRVVAAQPQQVAVQRQPTRRGARVPPSRACRRRRWRQRPAARHERLHLRRGQAGELGHRTPAALGDRLLELRASARRSSGTAGWSPIPGPGTASACRAPAAAAPSSPAAGPGRRSGCSAQAAAGIGDLVVVLQEQHELRRRRARGRACRAAAPASGSAGPGRGSRDWPAETSSCGAAAIVGEVGLVAAGQRDAGAVVEIVVPQRVEPIAALLARRGSAAPPAARSRRR